MKVEQGKKGFIPVTIILESIEDFKALYYVLGASKEESLAKHCEDEGVKNIEEIDTIAEELFMNLDDIMDDKGYKV